MDPRELTAPDNQPRDQTRDQTQTDLIARVEDLESRLATIQARLDGAEQAAAGCADEVAILRLVASYSPLVDAGCAQDVAGLWADGGIYDVDTGLLSGPEEIAAMVNGTDHQRLIAHGCAHLPGLPHIVVSGDEAVATGHSLLVVRSREPGRYAVLRATANRWELQRERPITGDPLRGWRVLRRTARLLDDGDQAQNLLGQVSNRPR